MIRYSPLVRLWIGISLFSLVLWVLYWFSPSYQHFFNSLYGIPDSYVSRLGLVFWAAHLGLNARFIGAFLGLTALIVSWCPFATKRKIRVLVGGAVFFEGVYFVLLLPFFWNLFERGIFYLSVSYLLQVLAAAPFLVFLSLKLWRYSGDKNNLMRWVGLAFFGYVVALWANSVLRWFDMISVEGITFLFDGIRVLGFLNAAILMSAAFIFALAGLMALAKSNAFLGLKWIGLAFAAIGLHYIVYGVYSYFVGALSFTLLIDIWTIPFFGIGLSLLLVQRRKPFSPLEAKRIF
jgi:hypothetical protein